MEQQLLFDTPTTEADALWKAIAELKLSADKTRRRVFSELKELDTQMVEVKAESEKEKFRSATVKWG